VKDNIIDYKDIYIHWLNENIDQYKIKDGLYCLTVPFLDRHNDMIAIYIQETESGFIVTDAGNTISDLLLSGFDVFSSPKRKALLNQIIRSYGVDLGKDNSLSVSTSMSTLPLRKHLLFQCIQKVDDLFYLAQSNVKSLFTEDVQLYLDSNDIRYIPEASFIGKSKFPTQYDFSIPRSQNAPERNIKVVNNLTRDAAKGIIFGWTDIKDRRSPDAQLYTFIQDQDRSVSEKSLIALQEYLIHPVLWSARDNFIDKLIA
jgi:hypothetical protein